jgi:NADH:ubiquinone oxidoreductase subunit F (NADH-binding)
VCPAGEQDGKCKKCRQCWNKDIKVVAYIAHGRKMAKQYKNLIAVGG